MKKLAKTLAVVLGLALATGTASSVMAHSPEGGKPGHERHHGRGGEHKRDHFLKLAEKLGLTQQQKDQLKARFEKGMTEMKPLHKELRAAKHQLKTLVMSGNATEAAIRAQVSKMAELETQVALRHAQKAKEFLALLTPEQAAKWKELQAERQKEWKSRMERDDWHHGPHHK